MNILLLTTILPGGKRGGGEIVTQQTIEALQQQGHRVTVLGYQPRDREYQPRDYEIAIDRRYIETDTAKYYPLLWMLSSFILGLPYSAAKYYSRKYVKTATKLLTGGDCDVVIFDHTQIGWLCDLPIAPRVRRIFLAHNVERELYLEQMRDTSSRMWQRIYQREARSIGQMEEKLALGADRVWTLTADDAKYFASIGAGRVKVLDIPVAGNDAISIATPPSCDLAMLGTWTWQPNQDGLRWFFDRVYPLLSPQISIRVAGKGADWLRDPRYANVEYCGFVPDARAFITSARAMAIPAVAGAGVQIKTLEAIAAGVPLVATPTAMRGINDYPSSVRVASTPAEFAQGAIELIATIDRDKQRQEAILWSHHRWQNFNRDLAAELDRGCND